MLPKISVFGIEYACGQKYFRERSCMQICIFEYKAFVETSTLCDNETCGPTFKHKNVVEESQ